MPCVAWEKCSVLTAPQDAILCVQVDLRGDAWARKNTQRQYHDRNFRNQLRSQNQRCLQLSAAACSACCYSKSIAARRAKNTSTNQSCLQQPYHCIFTPLRVGWPPTPQVYFGPWEGLRVVWNMRSSSPVKLPKLRIFTFPPRGGSPS